MEELPDVPLVREVKFNIYLVPSVAPIAKVTYHLTPPEMHDFSSHLQEILVK